MHTLLISMCLLAVNFVWNDHLAELVNCVSAGTPVTSAWIRSFIIILFVYIAFSGLSRFVSTYTCETINYHIRKSYAESLCSSKQGGGTGTADGSEVSAGAEVSRFLNQTNAVCAFISGNLFFIIESAIKFVGTFVWFLTLNPFLALTTNLPCFLILLYVSATSKVLQKYTVESNGEKAKLNALTETVVSLFPVIKLYDAWPVMKTAFEGSVKNWEDVTVRSEKKHAFLMSISAVLTCIPLMLTIWIGGMLVIKGSMTLGSMFIFINLSGNVSGILMNMPSFVGQFRVFLGNMNALKDVPQAADEPQQPSQKSKE